MNVRPYGLVDRYSVWKSLCLHILF